MSRLTNRRIPPRALLTALLTLLVTSGLLAATATPAAADNDAQSVSPGDGAVLTSAPSQVQIVFERTVFVTESVTVSVSGPAGDVTEGSVQISGNTAVQPLRSRLKNGSYSISWQVRGFLDSSSGSSGFRIARKAAPVVVKPTPKPSPSPKPSPTPSPTPKASPSPKPKRTPSPAAVVPQATDTPAAAASYVAAPEVKGVGYTGSDHLPPPIVWWGLLLLLAVAAFVVKKQLDARRVAAPRMVQRMPTAAVATTGRRSGRPSPDEDLAGGPYDEPDGRTGPGTLL